MKSILISTAIFLSVAGGLSAVYQMCVAGGL